MRKIRVVLIVLLLTISSSVVMAGDHLDEDSLLEDFEDGDDAMSAGAQWSLNSTNPGEGSFSYHYTTGDPQTAKLDFGPDSVATEISIYYRQETVSGGVDTISEINLYNGAGTKVLYLAFSANGGSTNYGGTNSYPGGMPTNDWYKITYSNIDYANNEYDFTITSLNGTVVAHTENEEFYRNVDPGDIQQIGVYGKNDMDLWIDYITKDGTPAETYTVDGFVKDQSGEAVDNATVRFYNDTMELENTTTNESGYYTFTAENGSYVVNASKFEYEDSQDISVEVNGSNVRVSDLTLTRKDYELSLGFSKWMNYSSTQPYQVYFNGDPVTENATVTSLNTSVVTVDETNKELTATSNTSIAAEIAINATYTTADGKTLYTERNVTVSPLTTEYIDILPPLHKTLALTGDIDIQYLALVLVAGVGATIIVSSLAGVGSVLLLIIGGWIAGWVGLGLVFAALFGGMLIMLNTNAGLYNGGFR